MTNKGARKISYPCFGLRVVAILPKTAIEGVHVFFNTDNSADSHTVADHFAIGAQIGFDAKHGLCAARVHTETADHFVEYQTSFGLSCNFPYLFQKFYWLKIGAAALYWLYHYGSKFMCPLTDNTQ